MSDTEKAPKPQPEPQQDPASQPQQAKTIKNRQVIAEKVSGTVKWFNVKNGFGFIHRDDTKEDVFVHHTAIPSNNPSKAKGSLRDGETVEFTVIDGEKGVEAVSVTGPGGGPVQGSLHAPDKRSAKKRQLVEAAEDAADPQLLSKAPKESRQEEGKAAQLVTSDGTTEVVEVGKAP